MDSENTGSVIGHAGTKLFDVMLAGIVLAWAMTAVIPPAEAAAGPTPADAALFGRLDRDGNGQVTGQEISADQRGLFERLLRRADANQDQALSRDEFLAGLAPTSAAKTLEEKQSAEIPGADSIRWLLLSMDTNGDGSISQAEVPQNLRAAFQSLMPQVDRDKNGTLERNELSQGGRFLSNVAIRTAQEQQVDVAAALDKLEKSLGAAFYRFEGQRGPQQGPALAMGNPQQARQTFAQLDTNRDGQVTLNEVPDAIRPTFQRLLQLADRDGNGRLTEQEFVAGVRQAAGRRGGPRAGMRDGRGRGLRAGQQSIVDAVRTRTGGEPAGGMDSMPAQNAMPSGDK
jgi:Ca2+-binding EF-hand superfamily protein